MPPLELIEASGLLGGDGRAWLDRQQAAEAEAAAKAAQASANLAKTRAMLDRIEREGIRFAADGSRLSFEVRRSHEDRRWEVCGFPTEAQARMALNSELRTTPLGSAERLEIIASDGEVVQRWQGPGATR